MMNATLLSTALCLVAGLAAAEATLVVSGTSASGDDTTVAFDLDAMSSLSQTEFQTINPFVEVPTTFSGPLVRDLLDGLVAKDGTVTLTAINDYRVEVPYEDIMSYDVIAAIQMNGKALSVREKGPIWIMYPISDNPELNDGIYFSRMVWQLSRIELN